jgi:immune inhibitor A
MSRYLRLGICGTLLLLMIPGLCGATMPPRPGVSPQPIAEAAAHGLFSLGPLPRATPAANAQTLAAPTTWRLPVVLVSFADDTLTYGPQDFERMLFDTTHANPNGSFAEYYRWASNNQIQITGRVVGVVRLSQTQNYYARDSGGLSWYTTPRNALGFTSEALQLCGNVPWGEFDANHDGVVDMVWLVHAGVGAEGGDRTHMWSFTSRMATGWQNSAVFITNVTVPGTINRPYLIDRFTVLPELSLFHSGRLSEIGVFCHEFGHTLGLPDLYDPSRPINSGPGNWSLMSSGAYGGDNMSPDVPTHLGAWPLTYLGWDHTVRPERDTTITLPPMESTHQIVDFWFQGQTTGEHFLIENRQRVGYDRNLPREGLIVYQIDENLMSYGMIDNSVNSGSIPGLRVVEGDDDGDLRDGQNRGDANDPLPGALGITRLDDFTHPGTRSNLLGFSNIAIEDIAESGSDMVFRLQVRPKGWTPSMDVSGASFQPYPTRGASHQWGRDRAGIAHVVMTEFVQARPQVVLRSSTGWDTGEVLSHSTGTALEPAMAVLPGGDLAVVWSDSRSGRYEIYYRARIRGVWTDERPIVSMAGNSRAPDLATDERGGLHLVWQQQDAAQVSVFYERFNYASPIGQPIWVTGSPQRPSLPSIHMAGQGAAYVLWQDRRPPEILWLSFISTMAQVQPPQMLETYPLPQVGYAADVDVRNVLHVVFQVTNVHGTQLWQTTRSFGDSIPHTDFLEPLPTAAGNLMLAIDSDNSSHLAYDVTTATGTAVRYRRQWPGDAWDVASTDLSFDQSSGGSQPIIIPATGGDVTVLYTGYLSQRTRLMERDRRLSAPAMLAPIASPVTVAPLLRLEPNPVHRGEALTIRASATAAEATPWVDVFDIAGRRVTSMRLTPRADGGEAAGTTNPFSGRPDGVYFVRRRDAAGPAARLVVIR